MINLTTNLNVLGVGCPPGKRSSPPKKEVRNVYIVCSYLTTTEAERQSPF